MYRIWETEFEFPETRRYYDPAYKQPPTITFNPLRPMRTFDIALKHLNKINLSGLNIRQKVFYNTIVETTYEDFLSDPENNKSNEYYKGVVFNAAIFHLLFKSNGLKSCFDVACEIVEAEKEIVKTKFETFKNTVYPKVMTDKWARYLQEIKSVTSILEDSELSYELFFAAYTFIITPDQA